MGCIRHFAGKPPKVKKHGCVPVFSICVLLSLCNGAASQSTTLLLGIAGFEINSIVESKAASAPVQWPRSAALVAPTGQRVKFGLLVGLCGFAGHLIDMGWASTNYELNRLSEAHGGILASQIDEFAVKFTVHQQSNVRIPGRVASARCLRGRDGRH